MRWKVITLASTLAYGPPNSSVAFDRQCAADRYCSRFVTDLQRRCQYQNRLSQTIASNSRLRHPSRPHRARHNDAGAVHVHSK